MSLPETLERSALRASAYCRPFASPLPQLTSAIEKTPPTLSFASARHTSLFNHEVGAREKHWWDHDAERFCCRKIDTQGELRWFLDRQIGRTRPLRIRSASATARRAADRAVCRPVLPRCT